MAKIKVDEVYKNKITSEIVIVRGMWEYLEEESFLIIASLPNSTDMFMLSYVEFLANFELLPLGKLLYK